MFLKSERTRGKKPSSIAWAFFSWQLVQSNLIFNCLFQIEVLSSGDCGSSQKVDEGKGNSAKTIDFWQLLIINKIILFHFTEEFFYSSSFPAHRGPIISFNHSSSKQMNVVVICLLREECVALLRTSLLVFLSWLTAKPLLAKDVTHFGSVSTMQWLLSHPARVRVNLPQDTHS